MKDKLIALCFGLCGTLIALLAWHAYTDHQLLHAVVQALQTPRPAAEGAK